VDRELEVIRDEMEQTRANLADKLGALETQVRETVVGAKEAVSSTVEGVKEAVGSVTETVGAVTEQLSVTKQVEEHPWLAMGAAVAAGFVAAQVLDQMSRPAPAPAPPQSLSDLSFPSSSRFSEPLPPPAEKKEGLLESMMPDLGGVVNTLLSSAGGLAVNSLFGVIRELTSRGLPEEWKGEVTKLVDQVADKLGGKPIDETRSSQLLDALGLGEKKEEEKACEGPRDQCREPRQEGAPYDPARQPAGGGTTGAPNGPQGGRPVAGRFTNL
jgi:ElaB/YqjD/DUF883 family membrane-anchored ribosome-binding protein